MSPLAWFIALTGAVSLDARIIPPILPAVAATLAVTPGDAGLGMTGYTITYGGTQVRHKRHGRRP